MDFRAQFAKDVGQTVAQAVAKCSDPILEPKYDGWRCVVIREADRVGIYNPSRKEVGGKCYTGQLPELEAELMKLPVGTILDGELVAMTYDVDEAMWRNDFYRIHTVMRSNRTLPEQRAGIKYIAFDCPMPNIAPKPLPERREYVQSLIEAIRPDGVELTMQLPATQENHDSLAAMGFEGSVVKCQQARYAFGKRGHGQFKVKETRTMDCVIMDVVMDGKGQHEGKAGRMIVGQYRKGLNGEPCRCVVPDKCFCEMELVEVAKVNCLNNKQRDDATANPDKYRNMVIEVKIYGWDKDGPRHPTPMRLREDKTPAECVYAKDELAS